MAAARSLTRRLAARPWARHLALILAYEIAGVAATWPLATFVFERKLPATLDDTGYVWGLWWIAHHVLLPSQYVFTTSMAAPVGVYLGYSTIMPLAGIVMTPVTLIAGPGTSLMVLCAITPGLLCYAMYRAARLWLGAPGALAAGAFFGLSSTLAWRDWYHLNIALGTMFIPLAIEAAIRIRRSGGLGAGAYLGVVLGASVMINPQSFILAAILAGVITLRWLIPLFIKAPAELYNRMAPLLAAAVLTAIVGGLQFASMGLQLMGGGATLARGPAEQDYVNYGATLPSLFAPSPQLISHGLGGLSGWYTGYQPNEGIASYGVVLTILAIIGAVAGWRKRVTWWFLLVWLAGSVLALGTSVVWFTGACTQSRMYQGVKYGPGCHQFMPFAGYMKYLVNVRVPGHSPMPRPAVVSDLMPYSWLVRLPLLSGMREADRFLLLGLIGAALLAGIVAERCGQFCQRIWRTRPKHAGTAGHPRLRRWGAVMPLIAVAGAGSLELGWAAPGIPVMPVVPPRIGQALSADHSSSIVLDVPFGIRGGAPIIGNPIYPWSLVAATADGHPRSISYTAWIPLTTVRDINRHDFYQFLMTFEQFGDPSYTTLTSAQISQARADYQSLKIGQVVVWLGDQPGWQDPASPAAPGASAPRAPAPAGYWYQNVAGYLRAIGLRQAQVVCIAGPPVGCPVRDQVQIWK